jgi:ribosomal protein S18 acetylase RimI-like enzyme
MFQTKTFNAIEKPSTKEKTKIINFLYDHLDEFGDTKPDIRRAIDYALKEIASFGGFVITAQKENDILGAVVLNQTGMKGYIPENILVFIATHRDHRGEGIGKILMNETLKLAKGDVALHVESNNPARFLYENVGFKKFYNEMRYKRTSIKP